MSAGLRLETTGEQAVERALGKIVAGFADTTELMDEIGMFLESDTLDRFDTETAPDGSKWEQSIRAREDGGKTLTVPGSAQLRSSITHNAENGRVEVGSNKIYAGVHNDGATIRAKSDKGLRFQLPGDLGFRRVMEVELPRRQFLGISPEAEVEIPLLAEDWVRRQAPEAFA